MSTWDQSLFLHGMCRPRFTSVQQFADNTGVVHCYLRLDGEFGILPHSRGEANECGCCFSNPLAYLSVQGEVAADSGPMYVIYGFELPAMG